MTGGGAPGAAGILKCLFHDPRINVTVADANPGATGRYLHADFVTIPVAQDPGFADDVLSLCRLKNIHAVLPLVTRELIPLASRQTEFEVAGSRLVISPLSSLEIANNKSRTLEFLEWRGIEVPAYRVVENIEQFRIALEELGFPAKPVCFKPSVANGSRGFRIVTNQVDELDLLFNHKPEHLFIRPEEAIRILSTGTFPELLVSEYLPGDEYSVDCLARHGEPVLVVPRLRKKMIRGISVEGIFEEDKEIIRFCQQVIQALKLHGNIGIQLKRSASGKAQLLEINPRLQGTVSAALGAGINFPLLAIKQELGLPLLPEELQVKWGTGFSRYWSEVFH